MKKLAFFSIILFLGIFLFKNSKEKYIGKGSIKNPNYKDSRLSIHLYSSPNGVDWTNPRSLFLSNLRNFLSRKNRSMGHVAAEVQCINDQGETTYYNFTGMTDTKKDLYKKLIEDKIGFGIIFSDFPGKLEEIAPSQEELLAKRKQGRVQTLTYLISQKSCKNLQEFISEYKEYGVDKVYGGLNYKVREKKGAGCAHFGYSLVDIANFESDSNLEGWNREVLIPESLIGSENNKVSVWDLFLSSKMDSWAQANEPHRKILFWDIDRAFLKLKSIKESSDGFKLVTHDKSNEIIVDKRTDDSFETNYWNIEKL